MSEAAETCTWCGLEVPSDDGFRVYSPEGGGTPRRAVFCRLEHVVPWVIADRPWPPIPGPGPGALDPPPNCSLCGSKLGGAQVLLVRHRGAHRIADGFCDVAELGAWAKAGGRWRS